MTVFMKISESRKIINNGKKQTQSFEASYDGKKANIMISKNGNAQYTTLSKKDINNILAFEPTEKNLLNTLREDFNLKPNKQTKKKKKHIKQHKHNTKKKKKHKKKQTRKRRKK